MQSTDKAGYKTKISQYVVNTLHGSTSTSTSTSAGADGTVTADLNHDDDDGFTLREHHYAIALQSAWRKKSANVFVSALKQEKDCIRYRNNHPEIVPGSGGDETKTSSIQILSCNICKQGDMDSQLKQKISRIKFQEIERMLFSGQRKITINDSGDNWNKRYQRIIHLPENTLLERTAKYSELSMLNHDFVSTAKTYAQTIISEYFLHTKDKTILAKNLGGVAGGQVCHAFYSHSLLNDFHCLPLLPFPPSSSSSSSSSSPSSSSSSSSLLLLLPPPCWR